MIGSRITMQSEISPNLPKYSRSPSVKQDNSRAVSGVHVGRRPARENRGPARQGGGRNGDDSGATDDDNENGVLTWRRLPTEAADEHFPANRKRKTR